MKEYVAQNRGAILPAIPKVEQMFKDALERTRVLNKVRQGVDLDEEEKAIFEKAKEVFKKRKMVKTW